jgi:hypothetical protein
MNVELADERVLILQDRFTMDHAEGRAWTKRIEAYGTLAKMAGFLNKPKDEDFELVYRERRLQPFWHLVCGARYAYERKREYIIKVAPEVRSVNIAGEDRQVINQEFTLTGLETCREENRKEFLCDGLTKEPLPAASNYLKYDAVVAVEGQLAQAADTGVIVVPPTAKASIIVRDVLAGVINKIDADNVLEETVRLEAIDLYYRPVYAFRYKWQGKEAVVEFDGLTGDARPGGATFEQYLGKIMDPSFLLDVTVETAGIFFPGARLIERIASKGFATVKEMGNKPKV